MTPASEYLFDEESAHISRNEQEEINADAESLKSIPCICGDLNCKIYGLCHCACGGKTSLYPTSRSSVGAVRGQPRRFIKGHSSKIIPVIEDAIPFKIEGVYCRLIPMPSGFYTIVDAADYEWLMQRNWTAYKNSSNGLHYVMWQCTHLYRKGIKPEDLKMSRLILGLKSGDKVQAEHKNGNTLDNRRRNLRRASNSQNQMNAKLRSDNTSGYKGVSFLKNCGKYRAVIRINGKAETLGYFVTAIEGHEAYKAAALIHYGEFARVNG